MMRCGLSPRLPGRQSRACDMTARETLVLFQRFGVTNLETYLAYSRPEVIDAPGSHYCLSQLGVFPLCHGR
jgi:hypothetical protein